MACSSNCVTQDHATWGECVRSKGIRTGVIDVTRQKKADSALDEYRAARRQGIQPAGTNIHQTRAAVEASNRVGKAYDATTERFKG